MRDIPYIRKGNCRKTAEQITSDFHLYVILFRRHQRYTATEKEFDVCYIYYMLQQK